MGAIQAASTHSILNLDVTVRSHGAAGWGRRALALRQRPAYTVRTWLLRLSE